MARRLNPVSHRVLVRTLRRRFGWGSLHSGGRHLHMRKNGRRLTIPNPHGSDIGPELTPEWTVSDWLGPGLAQQPENDIPRHRPAAYLPPDRHDRVERIVVGLL